MFLKIELCFSLLQHGIRCCLFRFLPFIDCVHRSYAERSEMILIGLYHLDVII
jgi:uncharacterized protein YhhL (DUF1145 family)